MPRYRRGRIGKHKKGLYRKASKTTLISSHTNSTETTNNVDSSVSNTSSINGCPTSSIASEAIGDDLEKESLLDDDEALQNTVSVLEATSSTHNPDNVSVCHNSSLSYVTCVNTEVAAPRTPNVTDTERDINVSTPTQTVIMENSDVMNNGTNFNSNNVTTPTTNVSLVRNLNGHECNIASITNFIPNNNVHFTSYSARYRRARQLKCFLQSLGSVNQQGIILKDLLNAPDMKPVLLAGDIMSPRDVSARNLVVDQLLKQVNRSSVKSSQRGRTNDHLQSYRTNVVATLMPSPAENNHDILQTKDVYNMLLKNTSISRSTVRRLVNKAKKHRSRLTKREMDTTWSIIHHRYGYNTVQKQLNSTLLEWIVNHPHVVSSPIVRDTVLVDVHKPNGDVFKERVGKLLLQISVRELHQDLVKPPPTGLSEVYCKTTNKLLVSERYLRNMLPPQLRSMTSSQKQMCGCEVCTIMKMHHTSLLMYRKKELEKLQNSTQRHTRRSLFNVSSINNYISQLIVDNEYVFPNENDVIGKVMCVTSNDLVIPKWNCVMNRCNICPGPPIPDLEFSDNSILDPITYGDYKYHTKCKMHGTLRDKSETCQKCSEMVDSGMMKATEKIVRRKEITMVTLPIHRFHREVYIPMLMRYKYHINLVSILSKNHCKAMRIEAFNNNPSSFLSERDYAERLVKELDGEVQSEHFGDNATLSIEGCTLKYHSAQRVVNSSENSSQIKMDFHSHFSDFSRQDAATTFEHMCSMIDNHVERNGRLPEHCILLDHTDGCAKQYRSGNALYLLNILCLKYNITVDRAICAPGHGKSIIDGLNAVDKHYLRKVMCMSGTTNPDNVQRRMRVFGFIEESEYSFAEECARLCGAEDRKYGVNHSEQSVKKSGQLSERIYHVQDPNDVKYYSISKGTKGWSKISGQKGNGI